MLFLCLLIYSIDSWSISICLITQWLVEISLQFLFTKILISVVVVSVFVINFLMSLNIIIFFCLFSINSLVLTNCLL